MIDTILATKADEHASKFNLFIDEILTRNDISLADLVAVAVSKGPGSYTGLRIGVSTAKGICYSLDIPLIAVNTLSSMFDGYIAEYPHGSYDFFCPMIDARRMEVYMAVFDAERNLLLPTEAVIVDENTFEHYSGKQGVLFGSGANKFLTLFQNHQTVTVDLDFIHSSAYLTNAVWEKYLQKDFEDIIYFEPFYLKEFIATTPKSRIGIV